MTRLRSAMAAIALLVPLALVGATAPAMAASAVSAGGPVTVDNIEVWPPSGGGNGTSNRIIIGLDAPTDITSVSAELIPVAGGATIDAGSLGLLSGSLTAGYWDTSSAIIAPPGAYTVSLSAADAGGDSFSDFDSGTVSYLIQPDITMTADRSTVDFDHQTVTFSGMVTGTWPDGSTGPLGNVSLDLREVANGAPPAVTIETASDGSFQYAMQYVPAAGDDVEAEVLGTATINDTFGPNVVITVLTDPLQVTASPATLTTAPGTPVTITGTATYQPQGSTSYVSAPGVAVEVEQPGSTGEPAVTGTTRSDGTYSLTFTPTASGTYDVYAGDIPEGPSGYPDAYYFSGGSAPVAVTVQAPVGFTSWQPSITARDQLSASACIAPVSAATAAFTDVQYSGSASGPWTSLGPLSPESASSDCNVAGTPGIEMAADFAVPLAAGYYRVSFPGAAGLGSGTSSAVFVQNAASIADWQATVSSFAQLSGSACVAPVAAGATRGLTVQYATSTRGPWYVLGPVSPAPAGPGCTAGGLDGVMVTASLPVRLASAYYRVSFAGSTSTLPAVSSAVLASKIVTRITNLTVHPGRVHHGGKLTVSGRLWQYVRGWKAYGNRRVEIIFEFVNKHTLYYIALPRTGRTGWFKATFKDPGSAHWGALYLGDTTHYATESKLVLVRVS